MLIKFGSNPHIPDLIKLVKCTNISEYILRSKRSLKAKNVSLTMLFGLNILYF